MSTANKRTVSRMKGINHVSNTVLVGWFEAAREPLFKLFNPELDLTNWPLILASYKVDFIAQIFYGSEVEIKTSISQTTTTNAYSGLICILLMEFSINAMEN